MRFTQRLCVLFALCMLVIPFGVVRAEEQTIPDMTAFVGIPKLDGADTLGKTTDIVVSKTESFRAKMITKVTLERQKLTSLPTALSNTESPGTNISHAHNQLLIFILDMALFILTHMWVFYVFIVAIALIVMKALG